MAKRYFNVLKSHVAVLVLIIALICTSEFTSGAVSTVAKIVTGILLIWVAISYAIWLIKAPTAKIKEENL
jgi:predicted CDP-diglyceride synthetase/phosphatidate cytidylyltransferase